ncbi:MAG: hypothetical protein [Caudoviricetes sp.]|nr:MAG: hypothetical protein [Caudoviricetes sp.]
MITWTKLQGDNFPKDEDILLLTRYGSVTIGYYDKGYFSEINYRTNGIPLSDIVAWSEINRPTE